MSSLLAYRNNTSEVMAWAADFNTRSSAIQAARLAFVQQLADANGITDKLPLWVRGEHVIGVSWPEGKEPPSGWYHPADEPSQIIKPHKGRKLGKAAEAELIKLSFPDARNELFQFGMKPWVLIADTNRYLTPGYRLEDDGVWVTWGSRDVAPKLDKVDDHGWIRIPLVEYIERFGEDEL